MRRAKTLFRFEELRAEHMPKVAIAIQRKYKGFRARVMWRRIKAAVKIQRAFRIAVAKRRLKRLKAVNVLQRAVRSWRARKLVRRLKAVRRIQAFFRMARARRAYKRIRATRIMQRYARKTMARRAWIKWKSAKLVQKYYRGFHARKNLEIAKKRKVRKIAITVVQRLVRGFLARRYVKANKERLAEERRVRILARKTKVVMFFQKIYRGHVARVAFKKLMSVWKIQRLVRGFVARRKFRRLRAARTINRVYKGHKARVAVRVLRAAIRLQGHYRRYLNRRFIKRLQDAFCNQKFNVKNNFGKATKWAEFAPSPLAEASAVMEKMRRSHWGFTKIQSLSPEENVLMRQKVVTLGIFMGKKRWNPARAFTGDYLTVDSNPKKDVFVAAIQSMFQTFGDSQINFADDLIKVNRKHAAQHQVVVVTDANIYKYKTGKFKLIKFGIPIKSVKGISLSQGKDSYIIVHCDGHYRDMVLDAGFNGQERYSELVTVLFQLVLEITGKEPFVKFAKEGQSIEYNNSRDEKNPGFSVKLNFQEAAAPAKKEPKCEFKGSKQAATISWPQELNYIKTNNGEKNK